MKNERYDIKPLNLADLTIEQKIGQMLLCRRPLNNEDKEYILELIRNRSLGGIHGMFPELLETADYPLLICDNMESGFTKGKAGFTCPLAIGATGSEEYAYEFARISAIEAKAKGFNVVFGPIFDIALNPAAFCGGSLRFGGNAELVSRLGAAAVRGYQDQGMVVTAKHYPGFGESAIDSHLEMVYLKCDEELLVKRELAPYRYAIEHADLSGVMVGHITVPKIDDKYPASLSPKLINILRKTGFGGLVITDSLAMLGITNYFGLEECHALAMAAGIDMVMASYRVPAKTAYDFMLNAYRRGRVTEEQIDAAVRRVIAAQNRTLKKPDVSEINQKEMELAGEISSHSITALLNGVDSAAVPTDGKHLFIIETANIFKNPETGYIEEEKSNIGKIESFIKVKFPNSDIAKINKFPNASQMEQTVTKTMYYDSIIMVTYNWTSGYTGSADMTKRLLALLNAVAHKLSAILIFGNPFPAREFPAVSRLIIGYENGNCEEEAIKVLAGESTAKGTLPIALNLTKK